MIGASADHGGARPHTTPKLALYYCRLAQQKLLNDQAVAILYDVFERRAGRKGGKGGARRAAIKPGGLGGGLGAALVGKTGEVCRGCGAADPLKLDGRRGSCRI